MKMLTTKQTAELLQVHRTRVNAKIKQGHFPGAKKIGRDWIIPFNDVKRWIKLGNIEENKENNVSPDISGE